MTESKVLDLEIVNELQWLKHFDIGKPLAQQQHNPALLAKCQDPASRTTRRRQAAQKCVGVQDYSK